MELIGKLRAKQEEQELTGQEVAALLEITEGHLYHLYSGRRQPGPKLLAALLRVWPDMESAVLDYLRKQGK